MRVYKSNSAQINNVVLLCKTSVTTVSTKINTVIQWNLFNVDTIGAI